MAHFEDFSQKKSLKRVPIWFFYDMTTMLYVLQKWVCKNWGKREIFEVGQLQNVIYCFKVMPQTYISCQNTKMTICSKSRRSRGNKNSLKYVNLKFELQKTKKKNYKFSSQRVLVRDIYMKYLEFWRISYNFFIYFMKFD